MPNWLQSKYVEREIKANQPKVDYEEKKKNTYKSKIKAIWILLIARGILYEDTEKEEECGPYVNVQCGIGMSRMCTDIVMYGAKQQKYHSYQSQKILQDLCKKKFERENNCGKDVFQTKEDQQPNVAFALEIIM